ncbi:PadR family transcriptional regulator [Leucobacter sp. G161]|uniref:PadR family transcriptional regulator n=1 Tax=Leucobacter sp. G161 TaxID=663704 RepID=UPI00073AF1C1|nr:PadR family transcriptional regulator [Leucobacter sp. G161]KUF06782.1 PadR family transcriptional regulator [Leucobacter sp. G161]
MDGTQLLKGVLDAAVLAVVDHEDGYGYDVVRRLRDAGLEEVGDASVYGTLRRLYAAGALSTYVVPSEGGPHRKYYSITPNGQELLGEQRIGWQRFSETLTALISPQSQPQPVPESPTSSEGPAA